MRSHRQGNGGRKPGRLKNGSLPLVDVAGAQMGGARRWLTELDDWISRENSEVSVIGRDTSFSPWWMPRREMLALDRTLVMASNNVSFIAPRAAHRVVLARNALHFLTSEEESRLSSIPSAVPSGQAKVVRLAMRRSTAIVAPSHAMAARIIRQIPQVADRLHVRFHPVTPWTREVVASREGPFTILCPVLDSPYKRLDDILAIVVPGIREAQRRFGEHSIRLMLTMTPEMYPLDARPDWVHCIGRLSVVELARFGGSADAILFPTSIESFGYPLAEARASGVPVLAPATDHNQELAGRAHAPYEEDVDSIASAVAALVGDSDRLAPDPGLFDPGAYFDWLFNVLPLVTDG